MSAIIAALLADRSLLNLSQQVLVPDIAKRFNVCRKIAMRALVLAHRQARGA